MVEVIKKSRRVKTNKKVQIVSNVFIFLKEGSKFKNCLFRISSKGEILPVEDFVGTRKYPGLIVKEQFKKYQGESDIPRGEPVKISGKIIYDGNSKLAFFELSHLIKMDRIPLRFEQRVLASLQGESTESFMDVRMNYMNNDEENMKTWFVTWATYLLAKKHYPQIEQRSFVLSFLMLKTLEEVFLANKHRITIEK